MRTARILLADSQMLLMEAVTKLLEPEFTVVGMVTESRDLLRTARDTRPDLVLLDVSLSGSSGLRAGHSLKRSFPEIKLKGCSWGWGCGITPREFCPTWLRA